MRLKIFGNAFRIDLLQYHATKLSIYNNYVLNLTYASWLNINQRTSQSRHDKSTLVGAGAAPDVARERPRCYEIAPIFPPNCALCYAKRAGAVCGRAIARLCPARVTRLYRSSPVATLFTMRPYDSD